MSLFKMTAVSVWFKLVIHGINGNHCNHGFKVIIAYLSFLERCQRPVVLAWQESNTQCASSCLVMLRDCRDSGKRTRVTVLIMGYKVAMQDRSLWWLRWYWKHFLAVAFGGCLYLCERDIVCKTLYALTMHF